jgi:hypothetical protein
MGVLAVILAPRLHCRLLRDNSPPATVIVQSGSPAATEAGAANRGRIHWRRHDATGKATSRLASRPSTQRKRMDLRPWTRKPTSFGLAAPTSPVRVSVLSVMSLGRCHGRSLRRKMRFALSLVCNGRAHETSGESELPGTS